MRGVVGRGNRLPEGLWGSANKKPVCMRVLDLRVGLCCKCMQVSFKAHPKLVGIKTGPLKWWQKSNCAFVQCCIVFCLFGKHFPPLISHNSNHFLLLWHHHDGPLPLMLSPQRWLHARPLSTPPLWPVCAGHTHTPGACDAARLGRAPVAWFSEAVLTGLFVSAAELKIKPGKEFG